MNPHLRFQPKQGYLCDLLMTPGLGTPRIIGGGGAKGGGKSAGIRNCALEIVSTLGNQYPGLMVTVIRRVFGDLKDNHIDPLFAAHHELRQWYREADKELWMPNGSKIKFAFAETPGDVERKFRGGFESAFILVDEAQQFTERELQDIEMAVRWTKNTSGLPPNFCKLGLFFNPGGRGSDYLRRVFWKKEYREREVPSDYAFLHVFGWDNYEWFRGQVPLTEHEFYQLDSQTRFQMFITETSEGRKYNAFPDSIRAGYLLGNFDHFEGQYFAGVWDEKICTLTREQIKAIVKPWWVRWMAQDWGYGDHAAHGWFVTGKVAPDEWREHFGGTPQAAMDVAILYREHVINERAEADLAQDIVSRSMEERRYIERFYLSEDAFGKKSRQGVEHTVGATFARVMREHNLPAPEPAIQDRVNGWRFMHHCLHQAHLRGGNFDIERARLGPAFFVSQDCPEAISSIPMAIRDEDNLEDVARIEGAKWEDVTDMCRYGLFSRLGAAWEAPYLFRKQAVYDEYNAEERTGPQMTSLALAMRRFDAEENRRYKRVRRR